MGDKVLLVDNYDSFTYNLVQYLGELGAEVEVRRNDEVTIREVEEGIRPDRVVISPGPGTPEEVIPAAQLYHGPSDLSARARRGRGLRTRRA